MKLCVVGAGYVGLVSGVCFAALGNTVVCIDQNEDKIRQLRAGGVPIYEPGLKALIKDNVEQGRLSFTTDIAASVQAADIVILAVGTPSLPSGEANLSYIEEAACEVADAMNGYKIIVTKSTVPVGTNERIQNWMASRTNYPFGIASVPEFLREGSAVIDTLQPDRIVIGASDPHVAAVLTTLHEPLTTNILTTDIRSAEMIKYASNAFLATKISFINEIANICEKVGADVTRVAHGMGLDQRIGSSFLSAGIGYGGSCFPKDTQALIQIAGNVDYEFKLLKSVVEVNQGQRFNVIRKLKEALGELEGATIGIWGLAFKPNTDDVRDAPAMDIIQSLLEAGAHIRAYDPIATANFRRLLDSPEIQWTDSAREAAVGCDALCLLTEWEEFGEVGLGELNELMKYPVMIDGRNVYREEQIRQTSFAYYSVGRPQMNNLDIDRHQSVVNP
ncbi:UDP-glucose/GDP-mannose dehydrogenase family protein [Paenibacillus polymyxa]|nr:UDP-glucose/GDP-mannose dehydrogenase family protein [Paenibacillus polymyxa]